VALLRRKEEEFLVDLHVRSEHLAESAQDWNSAESRVQSLCKFGLSEEIKSRTFKNVIGEHSDPAAQFSAFFVVPTVGALQKHAGEVQHQRDRPCFP